MLSELEQQAAACTACRLATSRNRVVFSSGPPDAVLMAIGEAPGATEDRTGVPFNGRAGTALEVALLMARWRREWTYVTNIVKCRPPGNRDPLDDEVATCAAFLEQQLGSVCPSVILALGRYAARYFLGSTYDLGAAYPMPMTMSGREVRVVATWHPAATLYDPTKKDEFRSHVRVASDLARVEYGIPITSDTP